MTVENKRVYELAKEYDMSNKDFIEYLEQKLDIKVKSHSSNLSPAQIDKIKSSFSKKKDVDSSKKPKAFIIKKAKPVQEEIKEEKVTVEKEQPVSTAPKKEIEQPKVEPVEVQKEEKQEAVQPVVEEKKTEVPQIRSLLEYNNRNSQQKRKQEMLAKQRAQEERNNQQQRRDQQQRPNGSKFPPRNPNERPNRPERGDRQEQRGERKPFDRNNRTQDGNREQRPERQERQDRPMGPKKPIQHHVISQDIYEGKGGQNPNSKKKGPKDKKKQYKNKEEEQELISLEKAISQKHKKKSKDDGAAEVITQVVINQPITVGELAEKIKKTPAEIVKFLMMQGILSTVNETISVETQKKICESFELEVLDEDLEEYMQQELEKEEKAKALSEVDESLLETRAPVISIMGHVDHGKTTLLDSIRASKHKIVATEVGGITQSIGAYSVYLDDDQNKKIVFVDTPGHEAFTEMRARGAKATDIAILVVAADDGIMPQTIEAINHARAAEVPIIVAVNKIDKPSADPDKILQQLTEFGLVPEEWGGDTICVKVSALQGKGIDELLEYILLLAEVQNLRANKSALASGVIIEAKLDKGKGPVATLLVQNGTLHTGDCFVVGNVCGRVRRKYF